MPVTQQQKQGVQITTFGRPEYIGEIDLAADNKSYKLTGGLPIGMHYAALQLIVELRATMPAADGPSAVRPEAPWSYLERIKVNGFHIRRNAAEDFLDLRGSVLRQFARIGYKHELYFEPVLGVAAGTAYDIRMIYTVPFYPLGVSRREAGLFLLDAPNYRGLNVEVTAGDETSLYVPGVNPATITAFGSAAGRPVCKVYGVFAMAGKEGWPPNWIPGRVWRYQQEIGATVTKTDAKLADLNTGFRLSRVLLASGVKATDSGSNNVFASLSDVMLRKIHVNAGLGRHVHDLENFAMSSELAAHSYGVRPSTGYALVDWTPPRSNGVGSILESFNTSKLVVGPSAVVDFGVYADVTGVANGAVIVATEELRNIPVPIR